MNNARFSGSIFSRTVIANLKCLQHDSIFKITVPSIWKNFNMRYLQHNCNFNMTVFFHMTLSSTWHASTFNMTVISIWKSISSTMQYVNYDNIFTVTFQYVQNDSWISSIWHSSMRVSSSCAHSGWIPTDWRYMWWQCKHKALQLHVPNHDKNKNINTCICI